MSEALNRDLEACRRALREIGERAADLPWAHERRWTPQSHLGEANGLVAIDLHDLSVQLATALVDTVLALDLQTGGCVLITGRGNHTGGRSRLRDAVLGELRARAEHGELSFATRGPGRVEVIVSAERARRARPGMGLLFWLFAALLVLGVLASLWQALGG